MTSQHSNLHYIINEQRVSESRAVKNFPAFIFFSSEDFAKKACCLHLGPLLKYRRLLFSIWLSWENFFWDWMGEPVRHDWCEESGIMIHLQKYQWFEEFFINLLYTQFCRIQFSSKFVPCTKYDFKNNSSID